MFFCPNCNNAYCISKTPLNNNVPLGDKNAFFICKNCGTSEAIPEKQVIIQRSNEESTYNKTIDYSDMIDAPEVARTRNYICPNSKCESHKNDEKREAVFFRLNNSYKLRYVCVTCKTNFE